MLRQLTESTSCGPCDAGDVDVNLVDRQSTGNLGFQIHFALRAQRLDRDPSHGERVLQYLGTHDGVRDINRASVAHEDGESSTNSSRSMNAARIGANGHIKAALVSTDVATVAGDLKCGFDPGTLHGDVPMVLSTVVRILSTVHDHSATVGDVHEEGLDVGERHERTCGVDRVHDHDVLTVGEAHGAVVQNSPELHRHGRAERNKSSAIVQAPKHNRGTAVELQRISVTCNSGDIHQEHNSFIAAIDDHVAAAVRLKNEEAQH